MKVTATTRDQLIDLRDSIRHDLLNNILPFWYRLRTRNGFLGGLTNDLREVTGCPVALVMTSRMLWTYARAYRLFGDSKHLEFANTLFNYIGDHFEDRRSGGYAWSLTPAGAVLEGKKQTYGQAFVVYAFSELYLASGNNDALTKAQKLYGLMERYSWKTASGGYWEASDAGWGRLEDVRLSDKDMNAPLSMNTHLHVMEAYANLLCATRMDSVAFATERVLNVMINRILHPDGDRFRLFFDAEWNSLSEGISPGHDIEGSWLIWETAEILGNPQLIERVRPLVLAMAGHVLANGVDSDGSVLNEYFPGEDTHGDRDWWPQAEGVVGFLNAYQMTADPRYLEASIGVWKYIRERIIDREHGEWLAGRKVNGDPQEIEKAGPWKACYHNGRMGFEILTRVNEILDD